MAVVTRAEVAVSAKNNLRPGLAAAAAELARFKRLQDQAQARSQAMSFVAPAIATTAAVTAATAGMRSALSLERQMYDVQRATDASGDALKRYEDSILDMARATGKTKEELAGMLAAAGFAGRPKDEILRFTEYASKATVAWGTNAQETAQSLAEIGNIYQANQKRIEEIGDTINTVADNSASKESDLIDILRRAGGAGKTLGISAEKTIAFGAALKELGVRTETAAMGMQALFGRISGDDKGFVEGLQSVGINARKFKQSVGKDATGAILQMLAALSKLEGTKRIETLEKMFGKEYGDDIGRLVSALPQLNKLLGIAQDRAKAIGSVRAGFQIATEKDFNRIDRAQQAMDVLAVRVGNSFKLMAGQAAEGINNAVDSLEKGESRLQRLMGYLNGRRGEDEPLKPGEYIDSLTGEVRRADEPDPVGDFVRKKFDKKFGANSSQAETFGRVDRQLAEERRAEMQAARNRDLANKVNASTSPFPKVGGFTQDRGRVNEAADHSDEVVRRVNQSREAFRRATEEARAQSRAADNQMTNLGQFGSQPVSYKNGSKTVTATPDFGAVIEKAGEVKSTVESIGPAGQQAGSQMAAGFAAGLQTMEQNAAAAIERIQQRLNNLRAPSLSFGGLNTGRSMPEIR